MPKVMKTGIALILIIVIIIVAETHNIKARGCIADNLQDA